MSEAAEAAEQEYIVQKNDTLTTISLKFDTTVQWLCEVNKLPNDFIYTGQVLKIKQPGPMDRTEVAYNIRLKDTNSDESEHEIIGSLTCKSGLLSFTPNDPKQNMIVIDLLTHLQSAFVDYSEIKNKIEVPDTNEVQSLLVVTYLKDRNDAFTLSTASFSGCKNKLKPIYDLMKEQAKIIQEKENFIVPKVQPTIRAPSPEPKSLDLAVPEKEVKVKKPKRPLKPIKLIGTSKILRQEDITHIRTNFPFYFRGHDWKLLYQLSSDGSSYLSFFEKCQNASPVVFSIITDAGERIGAYVSCGFKVSRNYYGSGETFVFRCQPEFQFYRWQSSNKYFVSSSKDEIAIGGGGASAIWIDGNFLHAFSESCPTFGSPSLTSTPNFKILDIEVWNILDSV